MDFLPEVIGASPAILALKEKARRLLRPQSNRARLPTVFVAGEMGTGKGLLARAMHDAGPRRGGPFVAQNCAAIPESLFEGELFGFERGAFSGAHQAKPGLLQTAHRGTVFLDEIGLLPLALQPKFLTVIEERVVRRLGGTRAEPVDFWLITSTNEDLDRAMRERRFREDLYHRLAVVTLVMPPLRERGEDVLLLAEHFLARGAAEHTYDARRLTPDARSALLAYRWPGNVRELSNLMERVACLADGPTITAAMLDLPILRGPAPAETGPGAAKAA